MADNDVLDINVDIVLCIDATGSMHPVIDMVKKNVITFYDRLCNHLLNDCPWNLNSFRIKVIAFRDLTCDGSDAIEESDFFSLPEQGEEFKDFVMGIEVKGGGDAPETALDVIAHAMHSDWVTEWKINCHGIMVWSNTSTKDPTGGCGIITDSVNDIAGLYRLWQDEQTAIMNKAAKRMVLFTPNDESWNRLDGFEQVTHSTTDIGEGMKDIDLDTVLVFLSKSL